MALITLQRVTKTFGPRTVLDDVSLVLNPGERIGLIGANGAGKTTIFRLMTGELKPDMGEVTRSKGLRVGYLTQSPALDGAATLADEVGGAFAHMAAMEQRLHDLSQRIADHHAGDALHGLMAEYDKLHARFEAEGGYNYHVRVEEMLGGLGFSPTEYQQTIGSLSGGQKCRAALAKLLLEEADLLLLDEPTNHLDIAATDWLERFLAGYRGTVVMISHDRYLLDRAVTKIIEVENARLSVWTTNYSGYAQAKEIARLSAERAYEHQQEFIAKETRFIDRIIATKRGSTAKGRRTRLERMEREGKLLDRPDGPKKKLALNLRADTRGGDMIIRCEKAAKSYGPVTLLCDFDFEMTRGECVGILGGNGVGKSTLLKMLMGQTRPDSGTVRLFENLTVGYYDQEHNALNRDNTIIDEIMPVRRGGEELAVRSFLARFLFVGDEVFKPIRPLSGGEQSRVVLAKLVWQRPSVLILDEPTNHLDIPGREALEEALIEYDGSILVVSHDRFFLDRVVDRLIIMERGSCEFFAGNYTGYKERQDLAARAAAEEDARLAEERARQRRAEEKAQKKVSKGRGKNARDRKGDGGAGDEDPYAWLSSGELEQLIAEKEQRIAELHAHFAQPDFYKDPERTVAAQSEYESLRDEVEALTEAWLDRAE